MTKIHAGDYVTITEGRFPLTWQVLAITPARFSDGEVATLKSGQSGRKRYEPLPNLTLYRVGDAE